MTKLGLSGASTFSLGIYFRETFHYVRVYVEASILGSYTLGPGRLADFGGNKYTLPSGALPCRGVRAQFVSFGGAPLAQNRQLWI